MNSTIKIVMFTLMLNIAAGILMVMIPEFNTYSEYRMGITYDSQFGDDFTGDLSKTIQPDSRIEDKGNAIYRILDMLNIGFIAKFIDAITTYMYGFVNILQGMFGSYLSSVQNTMIFGGLKTLTLIGYIYSAWALWTGKELMR